MKILLFGKGGQVGWELQRSLAPLGEVVALDHDSEELCGDFTNLAGLAQTVRVVRPNVIVNAAAHTAVDKAESEPELARTINALAPGVLAEEAAKLDALLIHYSTDYVFDGSGNAPRTENDPVAPLSIYGKTKLDGERLIGLTDCLHLIFRTSWVYAARGDNFAKTVLQLAKERDSLSVISDQIGAPTGAELLADVTAHAIRQFRSDLCGIYHLVASGETSWYDYARFVIDYARSKGRALQLRELKPICTDEYAAPAARPLNSRLGTARFQHAFNLVLPDWKLGVRRLLDEYLS